MVVDEMERSMDNTLDHHPVIIIESYVGQADKVPCVSCHQIMPTKQLTDSMRHDK